MRLYTCIICNHIKISVSIDDDVRRYKNMCLMCNNIIIKYEHMRDKNALVVLNDI